MLNLVLYINIAILIYFFSLSIWYILMLFMAFPDVIKTYQETQYGRLDALIRESTIPISIIVPAFNEEKRIFDSVYSILQSNYKNTRIIVVNDGSDDNTLNALIKEFLLYEIPPVIQEAIKTSLIRHYYQSNRFENLVVIDKEHGSNHNAADANNVGLNAVSTPLVITLDADTILEPSALTHILYSFLSHRHCISVGGTIYLLNDNQIEHGHLLTKILPKKFIPAIQCVEYFRSFLFGRAGLNELSGSLCYAGAFTLFETKSAKEFGGFDTENYAYDAEIILKFHHTMRQLNYPTAVRLSSNAAAWTIAPDNLYSYWKQRNHWQRGMLLSVFKHKAMLFNPKYGVVGLLTFPCYVLFDVFGPVIEFVSYLLLIFSLLISVVSWSMVGWYILLAWSTVTLLTIGTFYLSLMTFNTFHRFSDLLRVIWLITIEMFGFRQFRALCCFFSTVQFFWNRIFGKRALLSRSH